MKKNNNQGFSLVELILAIAILAIIMVALANFMGTTTRTYTRTKNDIEVQEKAQQVYDTISDKMMQATCIRIGTSDGKEYYSYPTENKYEFGDIDDVSKIKDIEYISIAYERKSGTKEYVAVADTYYYNSTDKQLYMKRYAGEVRTTAITSDTEIVETDSKLVSESLGEKVLKTAVEDTSLIFSDKDLIVGSNIESVTGYVIPEDNSVYLSIDMKKRTAENVAEGMMTIRNNYVLMPKKEPASSEAPTP